MNELRKGDRFKSRHTNNVSIVAQVKDPNPWLPEQQVILVDQNTGVTVPVFRGVLETEFIYLPHEVIDTPIEDTTIPPETEETPSEDPTTTTEVDDIPSED